MSPLARGRLEALCDVIAFLATVKDADDDRVWARVTDKRGGRFDEADLALVSAACQAAALSLRALRLESAVDKVTAHNASILENLGGGFVAIDAHGRLMLCNPAAKKLLELSPDLALG